MNSASRSEFRSIRTVASFVKLYSSSGVKLASKMLFICPALKVGQNDAFDWASLEPMIDECGYELSDVEVWSNPAACMSWLVFRVKLKGGDSN